MTSFAFSPSPIIALPIADSKKMFPVRRVYCIGRNYAAHAIEMGHNPDKEPPFFFQKNSNNLDPSGEFIYPTESNEVHFEAEMAVCLKAGGTNIPENDALNTVFGYAVSLDMTRRDLQAAQKNLGRPWEIGKAFERSAPIGKIYTTKQVGHPNSGAIVLKLNGQIKQSGDLTQMIWKTPEIISYLSKYFTLAAGDVILTGTPAGVGEVQKNDILEVSVQGLETITVNVL